MVQYALMNYLPQRYLKKANFDTLMDDNFIWNFKDGKKWATKKGAKMVAQALSTYQLDDVVFMCIPAACQRTYVRRCRDFSSYVCDMCGAINGFTYINVSGKKVKKHIARNRTSSDETSNVFIDKDMVKGKKIILFDDVVTTGATCREFKDKLEELGAKVILAIFLGKTKRFVRN